MEYNFIIPGRLYGLNEYTAANRRNHYAGAKMKKEAQHIASVHIKLSLRGLRIRKPVELHYVFYEKDKRRDHDNVSSFAHKVIQDALVECGVLVDDGWAEIVGDTNEFYVDKKNPRIEVTIKEIEE